MKKSGFTLVEIMIVVAIIGLLAAIAVPAFLQNVNKSKLAGCIENLQNIARYSTQYAGEHDGFPTDIAADLVPAYMEKMPVCKSGGTYTIGTEADNDPNCSVHGDLSTL